ncbi:MAG: adenylyl-sulfate kinase [Gammaproteobacteria bacterium]
MAKKSKGFTLWFTGLPCSGKSTIAELLKPELERRGRTVDILDGDVVRTHLTKGLGFSKEDRDENIRRIGFVCMLISRHGGIAIAAAISPYRGIRDEVRRTIENFVEIYVDTPLELCKQRDVKGMYKKALAGEIEDFTGVSAPYEEPANPEITIHTQQEPAADSAARILRTLEQMGLIDPPSDATYTPEEAEKIRERLEKLGYIEG